MSSHLKPSSPGLPELYSFEQHQDRYSQLSSHEQLRAFTELPLYQQQEAHLDLRMNLDEYRDDDLEAVEREPISLRELRAGRDVELGPGEAIRGVIVQLPASGVPGGNSLHLRTADGRLASVPASAKRGHTALERRLKESRARPGDLIQVRYLGKRRTADGEREYRAYDVELWPAMEQAA